MFTFILLKKPFYIFILLIGISFITVGQSKINADIAVAKTIRFYPNPASTVINFDYLKSYDRTYSLQIFNFMGKKVYELKNTPSRMSINLDEFYRGIYIFQIRDRQGAIIESGKFQVSK